MKTPLFLGKMIMLIRCKCYKKWRAGEAEDNSSWHAMSTDTLPLHCTLVPLCRAGCLKPYQNLQKPDSCHALLPPRQGSQANARGRPRPGPS